MMKTMWPDRRLIDLLQIEHPLVLAPMAGIGTVELAASVCVAGGLGSIGCAAMQPELAAKTIQALPTQCEPPTWRVFLPRWNVQSSFRFYI
jgi:nitronate monooxygenase